MAKRSISLGLDVYGYKKGLMLVLIKENIYKQTVILLF